MKYLNEYADENRLIMDQQQFETVVNDIGKEQFRLDLLQIILKNIDLNFL